MYERTITGEQHDRRPAGQEGEVDNATPIVEFPWSEGVVGMGYLPAEVGLPSGWTWKGTSTR